MDFLKLSENHPCVKKKFSGVLKMEIGKLSESKDSLEKLDPI